MGSSQGLPVCDRARVPKRAQLQPWTLAVWGMPVPCDSHQKHQAQSDGAGWDLEGRLCIHCRGWGQRDDPSLSGKPKGL